ncbi:MAG TPA: YdeI/OmpD-associated family protein [Acidimicrobiales bacterium]|nr:YdeI/OmpD-associated family protein [Acidimicrobiales bacterium]
MTANPDVDQYLERSETWPDEVAALRPVLLGCGLTEQLKWSKPCYSHDGNNIVIVQEMKDFLALMFFKGALLRDPDGVLREQGPNSRSARRMELTSVDEVRASAGTIEAYVAEAVAVEEAGLEVPAAEVELVDELQGRLDEDPGLKEAFESLTPGRQREYNLHIGAAKQSKTRVARVDRCVERILSGRGLRDR